MQRRTIALTFSLGLVLLFVSSTAMAQYQLTTLDSNNAALAPSNPPDPLLVNPWGLVHGPGTPWWISDNGSGWSTLYTGTGLKIPSINVKIPTANGTGVGSPTGVVFNGSQNFGDFTIQRSKTIFLFATLDGTISGWAPGLDFNNATIAVTAPGASYTGLAITNNASGNFLFAADNANNKVDMYDSSFTHVGSFTDTTLPPGFAPFGIRDLGGMVYVTFARSPRGAGGFIDIFSEDGKFVKRLIHEGPLNQPWGLAVAPSNFGPLSNTLLVSNNTNQGTINAFNAVTGKFVGILKDTAGNVIHIDQLWSIDFGDGLGANGNSNQLFFTAGPNNNTAGLFARIVFK
jgi:uncharacterized protein (TIGR03118 family)